MCDRDARSSDVTLTSLVLLPSQRELPPGRGALQGHAGDQLHAHHLQPRGGDEAAPAAEAGEEDAGVPQLRRPAGLRCGRLGLSEQTAAAPLWLSHVQSGRMLLWGHNCFYSSSCPYIFIMNFSDPYLEIGCN